MFFSKTSLESGIKVVTESIPHVRSVALGFWVGVGARDEIEGLSGMSHFIEHLLFKGTKNRSAKEISETIDTLGGEINAFATKEYTCFYTRLLDEHIPVGVEILSDMLQNPLFKEENISAEKEVVVEEINLHEDTPDEKIHDLFASTLLGDHPLGKSTLGYVNTVKNFNREGVLSFFSRGYAPKNIVIAAAGHLDHQQIVDLIEKHFAPREEGRFVRKEFKPKVEPKVFICQKRTEQAHICYGTQALHARDEGRFALSILDNILGGGMSSRLFQEIREKRGLVYSVYSYHSLFSETGLIAIYAGTRPSKVEEVIKLIQKEIKSIAEKGISREELHRAKEFLKGQLVLSMESTSNRMTRLGKSELVHREILSLDELVERIDKVTLGDIHKLAKILLAPEKMTLTIIGPAEVKTAANLVA